jgi:hypothetical protein
MKKTKFYIGLALLVQSFAAIATFFVCLVRKKNLFAAISAALGMVSGVAGAYMLYECKTENNLLKTGDEPEESLSESVAEDDVDLDNKELFERDD